MNNWRIQKLKWPSQAYAWLPSSCVLTIRVLLYKGDMTAATWIFPHTTVLALPIGSVIVSQREQSGPEFQQNIPDRPLGKAYWLTCAKLERVIHNAGCTRVAVACWLEYLLVVVVVVIRLLTPPLGTQLTMPTGAVVVRPPPCCLRSTVGNGEDDNDSNADEDSKRDADDDANAEFAGTCEHDIRSFRLI